MYFGTDIGRSHTKVASGPTNEDVVTFPSYVMPARELALLSKEGNIMERLTVTINGRQWFIGEIARREGGSKEFTKQKAIHRNTLPLMLTGIALAAEESYIEAKVVVGLPIADYRKQAKEFEAAVKGSYTVELPTKKVQIEIQKPLAFPECAGMTLNEIMEQTGHINNLQLSQGIVGGLDVGWKTLNFAALENMQYINSKSGTMPIGLNKAFINFYNRISSEIDVTMAEAEKMFPHKAIPELKQLAREITDGIAPFWPELSLFDAIFLGGGGGEILSDYLTPAFRLVKSPKTANARGFWKVAKTQL